MNISAISHMSKKALDSVGVFMAVYAKDNAAAFEKALCSVLSQRTNPFMNICIYLGVDGPLTLELEEVVQKHSEKIYLLLRNEKAIGLAATLNRLIERRGGEAFFFRMDSDDVSLPGRFQAQMTYMHLHADVDIVGTDIIEVESLSGSRRRVHFADDPCHARAMSCRRVPVAHPSVCFRSTVFEKVSRYPDRRGNEDVAMWFECLSVGLRFANVPEALLEFTVSPHFWSRRGMSKSLGEFRAYIDGIFLLWGWSWRLAFPVARLMFRCMPVPVMRFFYNLRSLGSRV